MKIDQKAPEFKLLDQDGRNVSLKDFKGEWLVLYFYPKDNTKGCTLEAVDFTRLLGKFEKLKANVVGVSPDSIESHCKFIEKQKLKLTLLSDESKKVLEKYGVWKEKSMYGRKYMGVVRTTFLIDASGKISYIWEKVKVNGHAKEVLDKLKEIERK